MIYLKFSIFSWHVFSSSIQPDRGVCVEKLDRVALVDNRPSTDKLHNIVRANKKKN